MPSRQFAIKVSHAFQGQRTASNRHAFSVPNLRPRIDRANLRYRLGER